MKSKTAGQLIYEGARVMQERIHELENRHNDLVNVLAMRDKRIAELQAINLGCVAEILELKVKLATAKDAVRAMVAATDEWAAEFTQGRRAMDWGIVNDAYLKADKVLK